MSGINIFLIFVVGMAIGFLIGCLIKDDNKSFEEKQTDKGYKLIEVKNGQWNMIGDLGGRDTRYVTYKIWFNKETKHYKLTSSGYDTTNHPLYEYYQNHVIQLNNA